MTAGKQGVAYTAALLIACWFLYFAGTGLRAPFSGDDLMNLHGYLAKPPSTLFLDNLRFWSTAYRPMGGLFYAPLYWIFGFHPLPFRIVCFALLGLNLYLLYHFCRLLSDSREVAFLATFLISYHAWFIDLYYSSGTIYDLLCFAFYIGAFILYIRIRRRGQLPSLRESLILCGLYICSLNAKEMAVTLPLFLAFYEILYHRPGSFQALRTWPLREGRTALWTALLTACYIAGKLTGPGSLIQNQAYQVSISPVRFLKTFHLYLNPLLYQDHYFHDSNTIQLLLLMLAVAAWRRSRPMLFAWLFLLLSMLPVAFIPHYAAFFLYLPSAGWALYAAALLVALRRTIMRLLRIELSARAVTISQAALVIGLACLLAPLHARESPKTLANFMTVQPPSRQTAAELLHLEPHLRPGARVLFLDDPFQQGNYDLLFLMRLLYHDMTLEIVRRSGEPASTDGEQYDAVFLFRHGAFELTPKRQSPHNP